MSSPFLYRLRVMWSKSGKKDQSVIPIYAFKSGGEKSLWPEEVTKLSTLEMISEMADGARLLTVCTLFPYVYRALESRNIEFFELHIKDTRIKTSPTEERRTVATITGRNMDSTDRFTVDPKLINMSSEPKSREFHAVSLSLFNSDGGLVFART